MEGEFGPLRGFFRLACTRRRGLLSADDLAATIGGILSKALEKQWEAITTNPITLPKHYAKLQLQGLSGGKCQLFVSDESVMEQEGGGRARSTAPVTDAEEHRIAHLPFGKAVRWCAQRGNLAYIFRKNRTAHVFPISILSKYAK